MQKRREPAQVSMRVRKTGNDRRSVQIEDTSVGAPERHRFMLGAHEREYTIPHRERLRRWPRIVNGVDVCTRDDEVRWCIGDALGEQ